MTINLQPSETVYLSFVIPCYNEEKTIPLLFNELIKIIPLIDRTAELIFVDDGSTDATLKELQQLSSQDTRVHYISFSRNFGKEAAILAGLQAARGEYTATLDADGQDPLYLIPKMLEAVVSGEFDCAGCRRMNRRGEPPVRSFFSRLFYKFMNKISNIELIEGSRDFRLMNRKYLEAFLALPERTRFFKGISPWIGFKIKWFEYENIMRSSGKTKWSFWKLFLYSLDGITAFSSKPLAAASVFGIVLFLISLAFIVLIIIRKLIYGDPVDGWASTVCIILFCSGIQLFSIGILGQYMAKVFTEVKQRPHFIIKEMK